ncbi:MAG: rhomboid family intramembrane serine protease [Thermoguttaceae bacterium]
MGFQDRDYLRDFSYGDGGYYRSRGEMMMVTKIIIVNVALFLLNGLLFAQNDLLFRWMSVYGWTPLDPLFYWQFLTYGFAHSPNDLWHIGGNMLSLFFLGYAVEERLGAWEFLRFYLLTIVLGGIVYSLINLGTNASCLGASGGVTGVVMLFILWYPHRTLLIWGVLPMPAWVIGAVIVGMEFFGMLGTGRQDVAYSVHIVGIATAFLYVQWRNKFGDLGNILKPLQRLWSNSMRRMTKAPTKKATLRVYEPLDDDEEAKLAHRVDEILLKYAQHGEASLSREEREILQKASGKYRAKHGIES